MFLIITMRLGCQDIKGKAVICEQPLPMHSPSHPRQKEMRREKKKKSKLSLK